MGYFCIVNVVVRDIELSKSFAHDANSSFIFFIYIKSIFSMEKIE